MESTRGIRAQPGESEMRQRELMRRIDPATRRSNGWRNSHPDRAAHILIVAIAIVFAGFVLAIGYQSGFIL